MTRLLWVGNLFSKIGGQNRIAYYAIPELQKLGYEVLNVGKGSQVLDDGQQNMCQAIPWSEHDPAALHKIIDQFKPEVILFSHDIWLYYLIPELKAKYPAVKMVGWFTIDAHPIHKSWFAILRTLDYVCTPTQFGRDTILQRWPEKAVEVIRYGVDRQNYSLV